MRNMKQQVCHPEMGIIRMRAQLIDESDVPVIDQTSTLLIGVREPQKVG